MSLQGTASHLFSTLEKLAYLGFVHLTVSHLGEPWDCWAYVNRGGQPCMSHEKWLLCGCLHSPLENTSTALAAKAAPLHCQVVQCNGVLPRISSHLQDILPGEANTDLTTLQRALMTLENNCKQDRGWLWRMHRRKKNSASFKLSPRPGYSAPGASCRWCGSAPAVSKRRAKPFPSRPRSSLCLKSVRWARVHDGQNSTPRWQKHFGPLRDGFLFLVPVWSPSSWPDRAQMLQHLTFRCRPWAMPRGTPAHPHVL